MSEENTSETREKTKDKGWSEDAYHLAGWLLFVVCALFFLASALKNQDVLTLIGSLLFLLACVAFLIPLFAANRKDR